jgi:hypothetical protein
MIKLFIFMLFCILSNASFSSSAMYQSQITGKHFNKINMESGDSAEPLAKARCEEYSGVGNCKLIYKTDYGGYGAIAIGNHSNNYEYGRGSQVKADRLVLEDCKKMSTPNTCKITSRWKDEGKIVIIKGEPAQNNCGANPATGYPIDCATGLDVQGNPIGYKNGVHMNQITQPRY